jgi:ubiquinone/menaquinone biosynthesis C-methylase UbiE
MSFDTLAPHYRWMEFVLAGGKLQRCRTAFLKETVDAKNVLLLGEGNGRFLVAARRAMPEARITCVDSSPRMLQTARQRLLETGLSDCRVEFVRANVLEWEPSAAQLAKFDLVVTHFFLDCFQPGQLARIVEQLATLAAPSAHWLLADFREAPAGFAQLRSRIILHSMYQFFRLTTRLPAKWLTNPEPMLAGAGFHLRHRRISEWGLLHSDLWQRATR